ncbi:MAG: hypothetical protein NXY57DRAFT_968859 [Lentinula lateritia]|nr:MAG: hypothetical protein NXY57DRAFT_968859 [Lentinula lateritia]
MLSLPDRFKEQERSYISDFPPSTEHAPVYDVQKDSMGNYIDSDGNEIIFSAGPNLEDEQRARLQSLVRQMNALDLLPHHTSLNNFHENNEEPDDELDDLMQFGFNELEHEEIGEIPTEMEEDEKDWAPHGSKTMFMIDLLDKQPRQRLSDPQLKSILWVMRECGCKDVPTFTQVRNKQTEIAHELDIPSEHHTSSLGNHFYMNHPAKLFALDWANPLVRPHMQLYPEVSGPIRESWQAAKWTTEVDLDELSPMWADWKYTPHRQYYVKELAQLEDSTYVVPLRWITVNGEEYMDALPAHYIQTRDEFEIQNTDFMQRIPSKHLHRNFLDVQSAFSGRKLNISDGSPIFTMPHALRVKAKSKPLFRMRIMPWSDDVSGNVSKQYNAHTNIYAVSLNLPHKKLSQEFFVRFCSTSANASSSEQFTALAKDVAEDVWHEAYDCELETDILFQIIPHLLPADNPQQAESASHVGGKGNLPCRRDMIGGTSIQRESDTGYEAFFSPGLARTVSTTVQIIRQQLWLACLGDNDGLASSYSQTGVKDKLSQYWITQLCAQASEKQRKLFFDPVLRDPRLADKNIKGDERKAIKLSLKQTVQHELWEWLITQPEENYNKLDPNDGMWTFQLNMN